MSDLTPQDLTSSLSVLTYLQVFAELNHNTQMLEEVNSLLNQYNEVVKEPDPSNETVLPYNRRDAYSILEYLKLQAEQLSNGRWTDFSDGDLGTILLRMLSYLADMNNYQIDKVVSELYLSTATERASAIALASLVGYEPRHYESAYTNLTLTNLSGYTIPDGTEIPAYTSFTDSSNSVRYCNLKKAIFYNNKANFDVYQGNYITHAYTIGSITELGRIYLEEYNIGVNTMTLTIDGKVWERVDDARYATGTLCFSVHITVDKVLYIQLPSYWPDYITRGTSIRLDYLLSDGENGRIGKNILTKPVALNSQYISIVQVSECDASTGGYDPETVNDMKNNIPKFARTMNTIVTINDFEEVGSFVSGISDISALDYNDPASGLIQPNDYYKVNLYVLPDVSDYDATDLSSLKYRNSIIKQEEDWKYSDMELVAKEVNTFSKSSVQNDRLTLTGMADLYSEDDTIPTVYTGNNTTSYLMTKVTTFSPNPEIIEYTITESGSDYILQFNPGWENLISNTDIITVYYKQEQILTDVGQKLREYIDDRRLTSLKVSYYDLDIVQPYIKIDIYMDKYDINYENIDTMIRQFILDKYSRKYMKIGDPIFATVIGSDILTNFNYIRYCDVELSEDGINWENKIEVNPKGFIDVIPNYLSGELLINKIIVNKNYYQNREI